MGREGETEKERERERESGERRIYVLYIHSILCDTYISSPQQNKDLNFNVCYRGFI